MTDIGFTHIALTATDVDASIAFYEKYAGMQVVHRRVDPKIQEDVAWISDMMRPFVIVLIKAPEVKSKLLPFCHLGVACESRKQIDRLCDLAREEGRLLDGPHDWGSPVGYWAFIGDPDGHTLEISYGQEVEFTLKNAT